mmetsp:Transcript_22778/g.63325  ORF Transcript_22778/g.63325 Transcript_22778/m.63325 type:complete len:90 (-) Transcript_22778:1102-1371(-)
MGLMHCLGTEAFPFDVDQGYHRDQGCSRLTLLFASSRGERGAKVKIFGQLWAQSPTLIQEVARFSSEAPRPNETGKTVNRVAKIADRQY